MAGVAACQRTFAFAIDPLRSLSQTSRRVPNAHTVAQRSMCPCHLHPLSICVLSNAWHPQPASSLEVALGVAPLAVLALRALHRTKGGGLAGPFTGGLASCLTGGLAARRGLGRCGTAVKGVPPGGSASVARCYSARVLPKNGAPMTGCDLMCRHSPLRSNYLGLGWPLPWRRPRLHSPPSRESAAASA